MTMAERVRAARIAEITGLSLRGIQAMAAKGIIPSAAKIGSIWTFDEASVRLWVQEKEATPCVTNAGASPRKTSIGETGLPMAGWKLPAASTAAAYERLILKKRPEGSQSGSRS